MSRKKPALSTALAARGHCRGIHKKMTSIRLNIEVAIALPVYGTYVYSVPDHLLSLILPGKRVLVPFGQRRVTGYVLGEYHKNDRNEIKQILDVMDEEPLFFPCMIPFFKWTARERR